MLLIPYFIYFVAGPTLMKITNEFLFFNSIFSLFPMLSSREFHFGTLVSIFIMINHGNWTASENLL